MRSSTSHRGSPDAHAPRRLLALWTGMLAGPIVSLALLQTNYVLSYVACETRQVWFLHLTAAAALALVGIAGFRGWRAGHGTLDQPESRTAPVSPGTSDTRAQWMALLALASSLWFSIVIAAMMVPVLVVPPCL